MQDSTESSAILNLNDGKHPTRIPVKVVQNVSADTVTLNLVEHDQEVEQEQYQLDDKGLGLVRADIDVFTPPVPLLNFPASGGARLQWRGNVREGEMLRSASAVVTSSMEKLSLKKESIESVKVQVQLNIASGTPVPAARELTFWFSKEKGLFKRAFGAGTLREPPE